MYQGLDGWLMNSYQVSNTSCVAIVESCTNMVDNIRPIKASHDTQSLDKSILSSINALARKTFVLFLISKSLTLMMRMWVRIAKTSSEHSYNFSIKARIFGEK